MHEHNVQESRRLSRSAMFGPFEICLETGELRKHGIRVRLQGKPFQILSALLEEPGAVLTREDLRAKLWSTDTYVDFESGLNTAVNRLRAALADSADNPIYVETLSRIGYRFVAPVRFAEMEATPQNHVEVAELKRHEDIFEIQPAITLPVVRHRHVSLPWIVAGMLCLALSAGLIWTIESSKSPQTAGFRQLTFGSGNITGARFSADGSKIFYTAAWNGKPSHLFVLDPKSGELKDLAFEGRTLAGLSPKGEFVTSSRMDSGALRTLGVFTAEGKPAGPVPDQAVAIDWSPNGTEWLVARHGTDWAIESPQGRTQYVTPSWIDGLRVSPDGTQVAFFKHPIPRDDGGDVILLRPGSESRVLSGNWASLSGLAWSSSGREVWFTAASKGVDRQLMAARLDGQTRRIAEVPGGISLHDISRSGEVLITRDTTQVSMFRGEVKSGGSADISWLDWPVARAVTRDGKMVLFDETGDGGGKQYSTYLYDETSHSHRRLGSGGAMDLSDDGIWALTQPPRNQNDLQLISVQNGSARSVAAQNFSYHWARFLRSDPLELVVGGGYQSEEQGVYRQRLPDGKPVRISAETLSTAAVDAQGRFVAGNGPDGTICLLDLTSRSARLLPNVKHSIPLAFLNKNEMLTWRTSSGSILIEALNVQTGSVRPYETVSAKSEIVPEVLEFSMSRNLDTYVYSGMKQLSTLFSVRGWK